MSRISHRRVSVSRAAFGLAAFLLAVAIGLAGEPAQPEERQPAQPTPPVRAPRDIMVGELPGGPPTPDEKLPAQYFTALGRIHLQFGRWDEAEKCFRDAYAREKEGAGRAEAAYALGQLCMRAKEYDKAVPLVEEAVRNSTGSTRDFRSRQYRTTLVALYERTKQPEKAEAVYEEWAKTASQGFERDMARRELLRLWQRTGKLDAAVAKYEAALKDKPDDKEALETLRLIYASIKPDPEKALAIAERLTAADPDNQDAAMDLLQAYERAGKYDKAIDLTKKVMEKHPDDSGMLSSRLVYLYVRSGQKDKALGCAKEMLEKGPETSEIHGRVASIYQQLGMVTEALAQYESAAKLAKRDIERERYELSAAQAARTAKKYDTAEKLATGLAKSQTKAVAAQAKRLLFEIYEEQNKLDQLRIDTKPGK